MRESDGRRLQLVAAPEPGRREALLTGLGLLGGLYLGRASLLAAATGAERIDAALAHFVLMVLVCVGSLLVFGRLIDTVGQMAAAGERRSVDDEMAQRTAVGDATLVAPDEIG